MTRKKYLTIFLSRFFGYLVVLSVPVVLAYMFAPALSVELGYRLSGPQDQGWNGGTSIPTLTAGVNGSPSPAPAVVVDSSPTPTPLPLPVEPVDRSFGIVIPKIEANARVIPNVSVVDEQEYRSALKKGIAHAEGTVFPGQKGNSYLFAHSTRFVWDVPRYNAIFYLLHKLEAGDRVTAFYEGQQYDYRVTKKVITEPSDTSWLTARYDTSVLTLQTCWPPGTTLQRLMVVAEKI